MRPGSKADSADLLTATTSLCERISTRAFSTLQQEAEGDARALEAAPCLVMEICADVADLMLWPLVPDEVARLSLAQGIAMAAVKAGAEAVGRSWP